MIFTSFGDELTNNKVRGSFDVFNTPLNFTNPLD